MSKTKQLVWLRNDIRITDNPALYLASKEGPISVVFIITVPQWKKHHVSDASIGLRLNAIKHIAKQLGQKGIHFHVLKTDWFHEIPELLLEHCNQQQIKAIWFNKETPLDENNRDIQVKKCLNKHNITVNPQPYDLVVSQPILNLSGLPFKVFTAFYKKWLVVLNNQNNAIIPSPEQQSQPVINDVSTIPTDFDDYRKDLWPADCDSVEHKLSEFCEQKIQAYHKMRDYPAIAGTSVISPYLALGMIGPRTCLEHIKKAYQTNTSQQEWLNDDWLRELTWRDFYRQLMIHFPHINKHQDFKANTKNIPWRTDDKDFDAWCRGQTGFPIIDAAMRQLNQTGWMHNRLRMLTASFLTKLLFIDWRKGERYFMQTLIDGEFAANNGGWQWSASTGCDSAPYFRVFNPMTQSEKFDKKGIFIKRFLPELKNLDAKSIHFPSDHQRSQCGYPPPIVDYKTARVRAIDLFKENS